MTTNEIFESLREIESENDLTVDQRIQIAKVRVLLSIDQKLHVLNPNARRFPFG